MLLEQKHLVTFNKSSTFADCTNCVKIDATCDTLTPKLGADHRVVVAYANASLGSEVANEPPWFTFQQQHLQSLVLGNQQLNW